MALCAKARKGLLVATHPPKYILASLVVCIGGLLNGLDTGVIGPVTTMPQFTEHFGDFSSIIRGITVSSVLLSATFASMVAGALSDTIGRSRAIGIGAAIFALGATFEAGAADFAMLLTGRLIVGIGEGLFLSTLVVYICEISPPRQRGPLASMVQVSITIGLCIGYFMCYGTVKATSSLSWRLPLAVQAGIALLLALMAEFYLPQSPRWLAHQDRPEDAAQAWERLEIPFLDRQDTALKVVDSRIGQELPAPAAPNFRSRFYKIARNLKLLLSTDAKKPMYLGVFLMSMQQLSGIDGVLYYAPLLFEQAGLSSSKASFLASGVSAILICLSSIPAFLLADKWGRRASTIYGGLILTSTMILIGSLYASGSMHKESGAARWVVIVCIYVFAIAYCMTWALSIKVFASEIQPVQTRATATSLSQSANCITNFFVAFITPILLQSSSSAIYFLFAACALLTVVVCSVIMPETRSESLEDVAVAFRQHKVRDISILKLRSTLLGGAKRRRLRGGNGNGNGSGIGQAGNG